jgi:hypothetical protein
MRSLPLLLAVALVAAGGRPAGAVFCKSKGGALFMREKCKRKETAVDLAASGAAPIGDSGATGKSQPRLRLLDSKGVQLPGTLDLFGKFVYRDGSHVFSLRVGPAGFQGNEIYYEGANCTGARFILSADFYLYGPAHVEGTTAYYAGDPIAMQTIMSSAVVSSESDCTGLLTTYLAASGLCCTTFMSPFANPAGPATAVDLGAYTPPFTVEVEE